MHDDELLKIKIREILKKYDGIIDLAGDSLVEEISQEINLHMEKEDGPKEIANVINDIDSKEWD